MARTIILYHGTSKDNAKQIETHGFVPDKKYNWGIKSKRNFVYLSSAYAPFYAMNCDRKGNGLALIKCEVDVKDLYPEDDFIMYILGKPRYTQEELDKISLENYKSLWKKSLKYLGNVAVKPGKIKIIEIKFFDGKNLIFKCDPTITPLNFKIMGDYYKELTEWVFEGNDILKFKSSMQ